jgi:hypothetical protein
MAGLLPPLMCAHLYITIPTEEISFIILHYDAHLIDVYQLPILDVPGMALHALPAAVEDIPVLRERDDFLLGRRRRRRDGVRLGRDIVRLVMALVIHDLGLMILMSWIYEVATTISIFHFHPDRPDLSLDLTYFTYVS